MSFNSPRHDLQHLVDRLLDGSLDDAEQQRLAQLLREDPTARAQYLALMSIHAELHWQHADVPAVRPISEDAILEEKLLAQLRNLHAETPHSPADSLPVEASPSTNRVLSPLLRFMDRWPVAIHPVHHPVWFLATATLLTSLFWVVVAVVIWPRAGAPQGETIAQPLVEFPFTAKLLQAEAAVWAKGTPAPHVGMLLEPQQALELKSGRIQILFSNGARAAIQGPARLIIDGSNGLTLERGRLMARVTSSSHGFVAQTPVVDIVDLGTEFGIDVQESVTEVHVFKGQVNCLRKNQANDKGHVLSDNEAALFGISPQTGFFVKDLKMNRAIYLTLAAMLSLPVSPMLDTAQMAQAVLLGNGNPDPNFAGLKAWYNAGSIGVGDGNPVASWTNSGAVSNTASQTNGARQPIWIANGLNNQPAVSFDGAGAGNGDQLIMASNIFQNASLPNTYFAVVRTSDTAAHIVGLGTSSDAQPNFLTDWGSGLLISNTVAVRANNNNTTGFRLHATTADLTSGAILTARAGTSGTSFIRVMGVQENSTTTAGSTYPYGRATIGSSDGDGSGTSINAFAGEISEILVYGALTEQQILDVESYLFTKYFVVPPAPPAVPEPTSGFLFGVGGVAVLLFGRRLRRN